MTLKGRKANKTEMIMPPLKCYDRWSTVAQPIKYVSKSTRSIQLNGCACAKCVNMQWQKGNFVRRRYSGVKIYFFHESFLFGQLSYNRPLNKYLKDTTLCTLLKYLIFLVWKIIGASYFRFNCEVNYLFLCADYWNSNGDCKYLLCE